MNMIEISEGAARKIRTLMAKQGIHEGGLRVGVKGGGCSGLSYTFSWEKQPRTGDEVIEGPEGAKIYVDRKSLLYLNGTALDYDTSLMSKGFVFNNATPAERRASLERASYLNDAYRTVRQPIARVEYLLQLEGLAPRSPEEAGKQVPPALLEEVFELNEELDEVRELRGSGAPAEE